MLVSLVGAYAITSSILLAIGALLLSFAGWWLWMAFVYDLESLTIRANINAYFCSRMTGVSHEDSLEGVIASRHPFSNSNQAAVRLAILGSAADASEKDEVQELVFLICQYELGATRSPDATLKRRNVIRKYYEDRAAVCDAAGKLDKSSRKALGLRRRKAPRVRVRGPGQGLR